MVSLRNENCLTRLLISLGHLDPDLAVKIAVRSGDLPAEMHSGIVATDN